MWGRGVGSMGLRGSVGVLGSGGFWWVLVFLIVVVVVFVVFVKTIGDQRDRETKRRRGPLL